MRALCHRCQGELPAQGLSDTAAMLFCPHCSAPQLLLPEHMQVPREVASAITTGQEPPPRPRQVQWQSALRAVAIVATVGAFLTVAGLRLPAISLLGTFWVLAGAVITLGFYSRWQPLAWMDARIGLHIGIVAGVGMVGALAFALACVGVISRFGLHSLQGLDAVLAQQVGSIEAQMAAQMQAGSQNREVQEKALGVLGSPEFLGAAAIGNLAVLGGLIILFSASGGAFAGMLRSTRFRREGSSGR